MTRTTQTTRAEIYELARLLRALGDREGARRIIEALIITENAAVLTAIAVLEGYQKGNNQ